MRNGCLRDVLLGAQERQIKCAGSGMPLASNTVGGAAVSAGRLREEARALRDFHA